MDLLLDYGVKGLGLLSTVVAMWLGYLQIQEISRKKSMRSDVHFRNGRLVRHDFSPSHKRKIWLTAGSVLAGLFLIGHGLYEHQKLLSMFGFGFVLTALALIYTIVQGRKQAEEERRIGCEGRRTSVKPSNSKSKRPAAPKVSRPTKTDVHLH
jgi:hypothetical protein